MTILRGFLIFPFLGVLAVFGNLILQFGFGIVIENPILWFIVGALVALANQAVVFFGGMIVLVPLMLIGICIAEMIKEIMKNGLD